MIRKMREKRGLTQEQLSKLAKVSQPYLSLLEKGDRKNPSLKMAKRLAKALKVKLTDLVE